MWMAMVVAGCLGAELNDIAGPAGAAPPIPVMRKVAEITEAAEALLRRGARATDDRARAAITVEMIELFREIQRDPRLVVSPPLETVQRKLRQRLVRTRSEIRAAIRRAGQPDDTLTDAEVLALADSEIVSQSVAEHLVLAGTALGGPAGLLTSAAGPTGAFGGAPGPPDYGPELVDLIQRTIVPDFWDVNGGEGTIVYYRPLLCLVVRATTHVHHRLGGVVAGLRGAR